MQYKNAYQKLITVASYSNITLITVMHTTILSASAGADSGVLRVLRSIPLLSLIQSFNFYLSINLYQSIFTLIHTYCLSAVYRC